MRLLFNVLDRDTMYEVISINTNEIAFTGIKEGSYEIFSWTIFEKIARALVDGKKVYILKKLDRQLEMSDIVIEDNFDELEQEKQKAIIKCKDLMYSSRLNKESILLVYSFTILNNYFADLGFFITDNNRESKYLEIINYASDNPDKEQEIINNFEQYLTFRDNISMFYTFYNSLTNTIQEIEMSSNIEEVEAIKSNFFEVWQ